jgi:subtilisin family serine protease
MIERWRSGHLFLISVALIAAPSVAQEIIDDAAPSFIELTFTGAVPLELSEQIAETLGYESSSTVVKPPSVEEFSQSSGSIAGGANSQTGSGGGLFGHGGIIRGPNERGIIRGLNEKFPESLDAFVGVAGESSADAWAIDSDFWIRAGITESLASVGQDLKAGSFASRTLVLPDGTPREEIAALVQAVAAAGGQAIPTKRPRTELLYSSLLPVQAPAACLGPGQDGPFPLDQLVATIDFNLRVFRRLNLMPYRTKVLVVDTGLGGSLATSPAFSPFLGFDADALLLKTKILKSPWDAVDFRCSPSRTFLYGLTTDPDEDASPHPRCASSAPVTRAHDPALEPLTKREGADEVYEPEHGSVVASIVTGGPVLAARYPKLSDLIALRIFRITRTPPIGQPGSFALESGFILRAAEYAINSDIDVMNLSLVTREGRVSDDLEDKKLKDSPELLIVTAAGNLPQDISDAGSSNLPATLGDWSNVITVAGLEEVDHVWNLWPLSAKSATKVSLAAPAVSIASFNDVAQPVCATGTSAAAPIVSFAASLLRSFGMDDATEIKERLLDTADRDLNLRGAVQEGRILNIVRAVDLFSDIVVRRDGRVLRGRILNGANGMFRVCKSPHASGTLSESDGQIDLSVAGRWSRKDATLAEVVHHYESKPVTEGDCEVPDGMFVFRRHGSEDYQGLQYADIETILFSPYRSAEVDGTLAAMVQ